MSFLEKLSLPVKERELLARHSSLGVGGVADYYVEARTVQELLAVLAAAKEAGLAFFILGEGSNILFSDEGFRGVVIRYVARNLTVTESTATATKVVAEAAVSWDAFVAFCVERGLAGVECLSGIPGTVGAAPVQNIGAYGQEVSASIETVEALAIEDGKVVKFSVPECGFGYRTSNFKKWKNGYVILSVAFLLKKNATGFVAYEQLKKFLDEKKQKPSLSAVRNAVLSLRRAKAMLLSPDEPFSKSVGSFFTNPILDSNSADALNEQLKEAGLELVTWPAGDCKVKLSAAWLIEHAGFNRGYQRGSVGISPKQALALVNLGSASSAELVSLAKDIQMAVKNRFGIQLEAEAYFVGFSSPPL
ncbi:UDP-N-acetylenolpyruvoylglucosamine reductase [Candidatus Uhrbacteria bacterium CG10_big_fil_rev_8_21_14_0_10_48_11]|uniref:UDP-N-acetylenolpyruvoylglucosamine reductase n=1 Tax=Candidatus Uhrbacteria bacterium CG10_big_fil_rev_8_21_14_0_10_48_11 TaxID=1975037 RepID=A0A2M8LEF1_9BACT|nr:MAG: UDP-N-acetylenolpyruvoylglucosamine reductase [Candidatus Uhrbacteria bacterium CG10_big_fil_rev_8_21_14_0_10_48_11]